MKRLGFVLCIILLVSFSVSLAQDVELQNIDDNAVLESSDLVSGAIALVSNFVDSEDRHLLTATEQDITYEDGWAFGMVVLRAGDDHGSPHLFLYLARENNNQWQIMVEGTRIFRDQLQLAPSSLISSDSRSNLLIDPLQNNSLNGDGSANLGFPFPVGETWLFSGGPHSTNWSALDFAKNNGQVVAARGGTVWRSGSCPNFIRIDHSDGWKTGYYHLVNERVNNGQSVSRWQHIGNASTSIGCGGSATGQHVHFSLRYGNNVPQNIRGRDIGGWTVENTNTEYVGCLKRVGDVQRVCNGSNITNTGLTGSASGSSANPSYDYNGDGVPDLWVVDRNDSANDFDGTSVYVYSGVDPSVNLDAERTPWGNSRSDRFSFAIADYNQDGVPDLWIIDRNDSASNGTSVIIYSGTDFSTRLIAVRTPHGNTRNGRWSFAVADYNQDGTPDLWAIDRNDGASDFDGTSFYVYSGADFSVRLAAKRTAWGNSRGSRFSFAVADYNQDNVPDLWIIDRNDSASDFDGTSVIIYSGADPSVRLKAERTPWGNSRDSRFAFMVADYNRDGTPDLWIIDHNDSASDFDGTAFHVYSGTDLTTKLVSRRTGHGNSRSTRWSAGDNRDFIWFDKPGQPTINIPQDGATVDETDMIDLNYGYVNHTREFSIQVQISDAPNFQSTVYDVGGTSQTRNMTEYELPMNLLDGTYYIRAIQRDLFNLNSGWTTPIPFIVDYTKSRDIDEDGNVSPVDAMWIINRLASTDLTADVNNDGQITQADIQMIIDSFGQTP